MAAREVTSRRVLFKGQNSPLLQWSGPRPRSSRARLATQQEQRQPHRDQPRHREQRERGEPRWLELFGERCVVVDDLTERFDHLAEQDAKGDGERGGAPGVVGRRPAACDAPGGEGEDGDGEEPVGVPAEAAAVVLVAGEVPVDVDEEARGGGRGGGARAVAETRTASLALRLHSQSLVRPDVFAL